jgi:hypothetical protein
MRRPNGDDPVSVIAVLAVLAFFLVVLGAAVIVARLSGGHSGSANAMGSTAQKAQ